jgi:hypothetical protein
MYSQLNSIIQTFVLTNELIYYDNDSITYCIALETIAMKYTHVSSYWI